MSDTEVDRIDAREKRSAQTELLLQHARKSLNEISSLTGLSEMELSEKYARLFEDRGWRTERMEERLLLIELGDLLDDSKQRLKNATDDNYASVARVVLASITLIANRFDMRRKLVEEDITEITRANASLFGDAYDLALKHTVSGLRQLHPDITDDEVNELVREGLQLAKARLETKVRR